VFLESEHVKVIHFSLLCDGRGRLVPLCERIWGAGGAGELHIMDPSYYLLLLFAKKAATIPGYMKFCSKLFWLLLFSGLGWECTELDALVWVNQHSNLCLLSNDRSTGWV